MSNLEVQAYFYGWKMCASDGSTYVSGTKYWKHITDGTGITSTLPIATYAGYTPYKLTYKLATPTYSRIQPSTGSRIKLLPTQMQIEQKCGVNWPAKTDQANKYALTVDIGTNVINPTGLSNQTFYEANTGRIPANILARGR